VFTVALIDPQIPPNTGNIARLCAAADLELVIVGKLGFTLSDKYLKRAGLDYWEFSRIRYEADWEKFYTGLDMSRAYLLTTKVQRPYTQITPRPGDTFLFGSETAGLPEWLLESHPDACYTIPMKNPNVRSLNLATSVGIVMYHALSLYNFGSG